MMLDGIALLLLVELLMENFPDVLQPWYADNAAMQGAPARVAECFKMLIKVGLMSGYLPER